MGLCGNKASEDKSAPVGFSERWTFENGLEDLYTVEEPNGEVLDVQQMFAPGPRYMHIFMRILFFGTTVGLFLFDLFWYYPKENRFIYPAYITHWTLFFTMLYQMTSLANSILPPPRQPSGIGTDTRPSLLPSVTWTLFSLVAPLGLIICILYWTLEWDRSTDPTIRNILKHGGVAALVWVDGMLLGRIAIRLQHIFFLVLIALAFILWTIIHGVLNIGNGAWPLETPDDDEVDDDALYKSISWKADPLQACVITVIVMAVVVPACFYTCWLLTLPLGRPKYDKTGDGRFSGYRSVLSRGGRRRQKKQQEGNDATAAAAAAGTDYQRMEDGTVSTADGGRVTKSTVRRDSGTPTEKTRKKGFLSRVFGRRKATPT